MKFAGCAILALAAVALTVGQALSDRGRHAVSGTTAFSIDGKRFLVERPAGDAGSIVERELASRRIDTRHLSQFLASVLDAPSVEPLRADQAQSHVFPLPKGLETDHTLRLETQTGPVEIAFGSIGCAAWDIRSRLRSSGWECRETDAHGTDGGIATLTKGKETSFVLLEDSERRFLAIRRAAR